MRLRCLIVDDEIPAIEELKYLLKDYKDIEVAGVAINGLEALEKIHQLKPEVVFLDINIPKLNGIDVAGSLNNLGKVPYIVFVTAYDNHAIEAFEVGAIDYLLKPINPARLYKTIEKIENLAERPEEWQEAVDNIKKFTERHLAKLPVEKYGRIKLLDIDEIIYAEAKRGEVIVKTAVDTYTYKDKIKNLQNQLNEGVFFRAQKSFIVNLNKVAEVIPWFKGTYWLVMNDDQKTQISVGKNQIKALKSILGLDKH